MKTNDEKVSAKPRIPLLRTLLLVMLASGSLTLNLIQRHKLKANESFLLRALNVGDKLLSDGKELRNDLKISIAFSERAATIAEREQKTIQLQDEQIKAQFKVNSRQAATIKSLQKRLENQKACDEPKQETPPRRATSRIEYALGS